MARTRPFRVLVATDGSVHARAAITTVVQFPWPARTRVRVVVARRTRAEHRRSILLSALDRSAEVAAEGARRTLSRRWADVETIVIDNAPAKSILDEAERFAADVIVVGWRGHGAIRRMLMGSVSARCRSWRHVRCPRRPALATSAQDRPRIRRLRHGEARSRVHSGPGGPTGWTRDPRDRRRVNGGALTRPGPRYAVGCS